MKKFLKLIMALSLGLAIAGCAKEYDDTALTERVKKVEDKVNTLDQKVSALTEQVTGLAAVIDQWKKGGFVEKVEDVKEGGVTVGYTITFVGGKTVTIKNGKDGTNGKDGKDGKDGTDGKDGKDGVNGNDGKDGENGKDGTNGTDGKDGQDGTDGKTPEIIIVDGVGAVWAIDGVAIKVNDEYVPATVIPSFEINGAGHLIMTIAGQVIDLGKVTGEGGAAGDSLFASVDASDPDVVVFELANGTKFEVPKAKAFKLVIENPAAEVKAGDVVEFPFTVQNGTAEMVDCFAGGNYLAEIVDSKVVVTVPDPFAPGKVLVWAQNDKGLFSMVKLSFTEGPNVIVINPEDVNGIPEEGGEFIVNLTSNIDIELNAEEIPDWITPALTKADYKLTLNIAANTTAEAREAEIKIYRSSNKAVVQTVKVAQVAADLSPKVVLDFTKQGYANGDSVTELKVEHVTATFAKASGSNPPKYYTTGTAVRCYPNNTITVSSSSNYITSIKFVFDTEKANAITPDNGAVEDGVWTADGDITTVTFTVDNVTGNQARFQKMTVYIGAEKPKVLTVERILCKIPVGLGQAWTSEYTTTGSFIQGQDRSAATDGEYAFVVGARTDNPGILAINLTDPSDIKELDISPMTGGFLKVAALNTIYNPSTGKYILLACSLSEWSEAGDGYQFNVYAYDKGIDQAPTRILNFNDAQGRHLGEIFSVVGDWHDGEIWVRNRLSPSTLCWPLKDGVPQSPLGGDIGYDGSTGLGVIYKYGMGTNHVLLENEKLGVFYNLTVNGYFAAFQGDLWSGKDQSVMGRKYGVKPFEFDGKKFIAYTQIGKYTDPNNGARARLKIIEDQGSDATFKASIESDNILYEYPIQNSNDNATTPAEFDEVLYLDGPSFIPDNRVLGSCSVAETADAVYILSHCYNVGLSVFKMYLK